VNEPRDGGTAFPMQEPQAIHAYASAAVLHVTDPDQRDLIYMAARAQAVGGMTLRDYFIAHAPSEPQPWFAPVLPPAETPLPRFVDMYTDVTDEERGALNHFDADYMSVEDVEEERVRNYLFQKEEQHKRSRAYNAMAERERWVQWPAAWADAMLKAKAP
jgi:hypothetical protein